MYYLIAEGEFYEAGMRDYVAVPVLAAEIITLGWEGTVLAVAYRHDGSGRYANTPEPGPSTTLYSDWRDCLADQPVGIDRAELDAVFNEGWE